MFVCGDKRKRSAIAMTRRNIKLIPSLNLETPGTCSMPTPFDVVFQWLAIAVGVFIVAGIVVAKWRAPYTLGSHGVL